MTNFYGENALPQYTTLRWWVDMFSAVWMYIYKSFLLITIYMYATSINTCVICWQLTDYTSQNIPMTDKCVGLRFIKLWLLSATVSTIICNTTHHIRFLLTSNKLIFSYTNFVYFPTTHRHTTQRLRVPVGLTRVPDEQWKLNEGEATNAQHHTRPAGQAKEDWNWTPAAAKSALILSL